MDQNTGRTPHAEEPAEGSPEQNPQHNTAPDGQSSVERDELHGNAQGSTPVSYTHLTLPTTPYV